MTDESTPPESAQTTFESPTSVRMARTASSTNERADQSPGIPAMPCT